MSGSNGWSVRASAASATNAAARRGPRRDRDDGIGRAEREQYFAKPHGSDRRDKQPDPNSPFAKLAALKQQLEQGAKEPS